MIRTLKRGADQKTEEVVAAAGSFAAISTLFGSPLSGAFLLMEASGLGGSALQIVLLPGLLASGIGALIFVGLGSWTGLGSLSLTVSNPPHASSPPSRSSAGRWCSAWGVRCSGCSSSGAR